MRFICKFLFASRIENMTVYNNKFLRNFYQSNLRYIHYTCKKLCALKVANSSNDNALQITPDIQITDFNIEEDKNDALSECKEDVSSYTPYHQPSFNLAAYVNKSYTLQQFVDMGVNLYRLEGIKGCPEAILKLDFERDVKKYLLYLTDLGVSPDDFGSIITKCPSILFQDLENLNIRQNYLESKNFSPEDIIRILTINPSWFTWKTQDIDHRLGFFQHDFRLSGDEVRHVSVRMPKLITYKLPNIKLSIFAVREEMGFSKGESKSLLLNKPKIYTLNRKGLVSRFDYIHNVMKIPHSLLTLQPDGLLHREIRLKARHGFLSSLSRDQYDPAKPNYVSMKALLSGTDGHFAMNIAKSSIQIYNQFLKSL